MEKMIRRAPVTLTLELEREVRKLKMLPEFCMSSVSEVIRQLLVLGIERVKEKEST